jgi:hypothetical protein
MMDLSMSEGCLFETATVHRREVVVSIGSVAAGFAAVDPAVAQSGPGITVVINTDKTEAKVGEECIIELIIEDATAGIAAFEFEIEFTESRSVELGEIIINGDSLVERVERNDRAVNIEAALGENPIDSTTTLAVATLSVRGTTPGTISLEFGSVTVSDRTNTPYQVSQMTGNSIQIGSDDREDRSESGDTLDSNLNSSQSGNSVTEETTQPGENNRTQSMNATQRANSEDNSGPGFGFTTVLGALAAIFELLRRKKDAKTGQD